jgi:hypothetical protein
VICPKCGRPVDESAVICPGCDFILDTEFLGGDILDEEHQLRPGQGGVDPAVFNLADAVILGNIGDDTSSFETSDSGFHLKQDLGAARLYVSGRSQAVMSPDAVIATIDAGAKNVRLTPFEKHVLRFIDGKRPVEAIRRQAGLDEAEVKTALATLADKGVVKVVGRALADADFDVDTAPGNAPKKSPRRVRGTLVGAVVVVGDAADQAIDDAFRTQVRGDVRPDVRDLDVKDDGGDVFSSDADGSVPAADSADIASFDLAGTEEVRAKRKPQTSSTSTVRPAALRNAVNAGGGGRSPHTPRHVPVLSDVDQSDGFDDFGDASDIATAMVQQPSLSEESSLPGVDSPTGGLRGGAFADAPPGRGLSDLDDFDAPGVDDLADSRVEPRPVLAAPPALPSVSASSLSGVVKRGTSPSMNEQERGAASGSVWGDHDGGGVTNVRQQPSGLHSDLSTSLSALLGDDSDDASAEVGATAPGRFADAVAPGRVPARDLSLEDDFDSGEEPTGVREPPPAMRPARPVAAPQPAPPPVLAPPPVAAPSPPPTPARDDSEDAWEPSTPRDRPSQPMPRVPARPSSPPPAQIADPRAGAADDLFPEDDDFEGATGTVDSDVSTGVRQRAPEPTLPPSVVSAAGANAADGNDDYDEDSAWSSSNSDAGRQRPQPSAPEPSLFDSVAQSMSRGPGPTGLVDSLSASSEVVDSAMVIRPAIRPAIKATPLAALSSKKSAAAKPTPAPPPPPPPEDDEGDFMVDPDATANLPALPKSMEGEERRRRREAGGPVAAAAPQSAMLEPTPAPQNRRAPTEDMRRKARNLMEQAQQDHAVGRLGAARMNAKLATIYDPDNEQYKRILGEWERPSTEQGSRPEYVALYEEAQAREDDDDIDGAIGLLEKGLRLAPNPAAFHNRIGVLLAMRKRDFERARDEIQKAIALEPGNAHYRNNLGKVMAKANRRRGDAVANAR